MTAEEVTRIHAIFIMGTSGFWQNGGMQLEPFKCSADLCALLDKAVRSTEIYARAEAEPWRWSKPIGDFPELDKKFEREVRQQTHAALTKALFDERPTALSKEIEALNQALLGMSSGYGAPAFMIGNLPEGVAGTMAASGLLSLYSNLKKDGGRLERITEHQHRSHDDHATVRMHRDGEGPLLGVLKGVSVGPKPLTTVVHRVDEVIDETARHYRRMRSGTDMAVPLSGQERESMCHMLKRSIYSFDGLQVQPLLLEDPEGRTRGDRWRWHPAFTGNKMGKSEEDFANELAERVPMQLTEMRTAAEALSKALISLKEKDGIVIGADEAIFYNNSFVLHSSGTFVQDARASAAPREVIAMEAEVTQRQHQRDHGKVDAPTRRCLEMMSQGYVQLADDIKKDKPR